MVAEQPVSQELVEEKQTEMLDNWSQLTERADERKNNLLQSRELQQFLADLRDLVGVVCDSCYYKLYKSELEM